MDAITIAGDFFVETSQDAEYWVAGLTYLRTASKMFYGTGANVGNPPPIVKLNGYGDYVFKDTPVIITNFTVDMPTEVDYIATGISQTGSNFNEPRPGPIGQNDATIQQQAEDGKITWAPAESQFTVTCQPIYSRDKVEKFNYKSFVNGDGITGGYL